MIPAPKPGCYEGVPEHIYHSWDALSASVMRDLAQYPPAQVYHDRLHPKNPTPAMEFGRMVHALVLEGASAAEARFAEGPDVDLRTTEGKKLWQEFERTALAAGKQAMRPPEFAKCTAMHRMVYRDAYARLLLEAPGYTEVSLVWHDALLDFPCKARLDRVIRLGGTTLILDLKTAHSAAPDAFRRIIADKHYDIQPVWYPRALEAVFGPASRQFLWLAVDKDPPHLPAVYQPGPAALERGHASVDRLSRLYVTCRRDDVWPGYTEGGEAVVLDLPRWAWLRKDGEEFSPPPDDPNDQEIRF